MISAGSELCEDTLVPTIHISRSAANEYGVSFVSVAWSGLDGASLTLLGPETRHTGMTQEEFARLAAVLGNSVKVEFK